MAVRTESVVVGWTDDYDQSEHDGKTQPVVVEFHHRGQAYAADLTKLNADKLNAALAVLDDFASRLKPVPGLAKRVSKTTRTRDYDLGDLREWAAATGVKIAPKGRLAGSVVDAYKKAKTEGWEAR